MIAQAFSIEGIELGRSRKKAAKNAGQQKSTTTPKSPPVPAPEPVERAARPTPQQAAKTDFRYPSGPGRQDQPVVNLRADMIALLMLPPAQLDGIQHDAARDWQELRADVAAEIGLRGYRSCLDISIAGHDETDGNAPLMAYWRMVNRVLGPRRVALLDAVCVEGAKPVDLEAFKAALDAFAIAAGRA